MNLDQFLIENFKISPERAALISEQVKKPNNVFESLEELKEKKEKLKKIGMSQKEISDLFIQINKLKISLLTLDTFFIENENKNDEITTSNNDIHDDDQAVLFENFIEYYKKTHKAEFDNQDIEILKSAFKQKLKDMKTKEKKSLVTFSSIIGSNAISNVVKSLVLNKMPMCIAKNALSFGDELVSYLGTLDILKSHAIGATVMFSLMMCFSIGKNFVRLCKKEGTPGSICFKQFCKLVAVDAVAYGVTTGCATAGSIIGGMLGTALGGPVGTLIGSLLGGAVGGMLSNYFIEARIRGFLNGQFLDALDDKNILSPQEIYKEALKVYDVPENVTKAQICNLRRQTLLIHHPDKNGNTPESNANLIKYEAAFNVIKNYREEMKDW